MAKDEEADKKGQLTNKIPTGSNHSSHFASSLFKNSTFHVEWQIQIYLDSDDDDDVIVSDPLLQIRPLNFAHRERSRAECGK